MSVMLGEKKIRIRETLNLPTCADSITIAMKKKQKLIGGIFFWGLKEIQRGSTKIFVGGFNIFFPAVQKKIGRGLIFSRPGQSQGLLYKHLCH